MKKACTAVLAAGMCVSLFAFDVETYLPLKGTVKSYTRTDYSVTSKFGDYFRTPETKMTHILDNAGLETESSEMTPRDVVQNKVQNSYDATGKLTAQAGYNADGALIWKSVITYAANGNKTDISEYGKDGALKGKTLYAYNGTKLADETYYNGDGTIAWKTTYAYNDAGQVSVESYYYADGSLDEERDYAYTPAGKIDSIAYLNGYGTVTSRETFRYGTDGVLNEITTSGADGKTTKRMLLKYDTAGNLAKISTYTVSRKFGTAVTELADISEISYQY